MSKLNQVVFHNTLRKRSMGISSIYPSATPCFCDGINGHEILTLNGRFFGDELPGFLWNDAGDY